MVDGPRYLLDANVFIEAARRYYAFDLAPRFWESLVNLARQGTIRSIDRVKQELDKGKNHLAQWANQPFSHAFESTDDADIIRSYQKIMVWVQSQTQFSPAAKAEFADEADGWLVAYAMTKGFVVVTHELPADDAKRRVPLPNVCQAFDVAFVDTFEMLRAAKVQIT